uniref:Putative hydrolase, alpha/beta fold family n=1 Tax=Trypanosoma congolense (strain IL3000) TaxID=1068625 RepID=G0UMV3_TRYCI|nr:putative hydrolase, alpha/beta fold family [Trypanosoma congolense IL3000]
MPPTPDTVIYVGKCGSTGEDISICYNTFGKPSDPCLLLVMGLNGVAPMWRDEFCEMLADGGFYVIRYDNRDMGLSTRLKNHPPPGIFRMFLPQCLSFGATIPYTLDDMAADGMNLLTALGIEKAHIVGSSMGGMIVQVMAIKYPDRVLSLNIIYSHTGSSKRIPETYATKLLFLKKPKSDSVEDLLEFKCMLGRHLRGPGYEVADEDFKLFLRRMLERAPENPEGMLRQLAAIQRAESRDEGLKKVNVPTLVIHGLLDEVVPYGNGIQIAELVGLSAKLVLYPRMGHEIHVELVPSITQEIICNCRRAPPTS